MPTTQSQPTTTPNRRIRVFISSTFRDMIGERDELMTHAWPELRRFCRERQVELVEVDLRWGIAEEQSTRKETLKLCLDEIHACRPFFIGLLGERYGWVPGDDAFTADLREEQPWLRDLHGKSQVELEILHGVLNNPQMAPCAFFYFRDPKYIEFVPVECRTDFAAENSESALKQSRLKDLVRRTCHAYNILLREDYSDPHQLAKFVLEDLKAAFEAHFPKDDVPDPITREARGHEAFAENRKRLYIGRDDYFATLDAHALGNGGPLVVLGDKGSGKSALVANWLEHWRAAHPGDFLFQHYIGGTENSTDHRRLLNRLIAEIRRWCGAPDGQPQSREDILKTLPVWLDRASTKAAEDGVRIILVIDALDRIDDQDQAGSLEWLSGHVLASPLRLVLSTRSGKTLEAVRALKWRSIQIEALTIEERRCMVKHHLARFGKKLDEARLVKITAAPAADNPAHLVIFLNELVVTGTHDRLDDHINRYLAAQSFEQIYEDVLDRWERDYERYRPHLVRDAMRLLWAAPYGLYDAEIRSIVGHTNSPGALRSADWTPFYSALEDFLMFAPFGRVIADSSLLLAVERRYLRSEQDRLIPHKSLADFYFALGLPHLDGNLKAIKWLPFHAFHATDNDTWLSTLTDFGFLHEVVERVDVTEGRDANGEKMPWHTGYFIVLDEITRWLSQKPTLTEASDLIEPLNAVWERHPEFVRSGKYLMPTLYHELKRLEKTPPKKIMDRIRFREIVQHGPLWSWCERERQKYDDVKRPWSVIIARPDVFVSYRREGGEHLAGRVRDALKSRGLSVFMDVEDLKSGKFDEDLLEIIAEATDVVVILTPGCLERCINKNDWLRQEIRHAIICKKNVVPIIARGFQMPLPENLPSDIADLPKFNGLTSTHELFEASIDRLVSTFLKAGKIE